MTAHSTDPIRSYVSIPGLHWVIAGGESGHGCRRMDPAWAEQLRVQCAAAGVAFNFKQYGSLAARELGLSGKGDDPDTWPRQWPREYPDARRATIGATV